MKKLTVLVVIMLVAGLLAGCWLFSGESKLIAINVEPEWMDLDEPAAMISMNTKAIESVTACYEDWTTKEITLTDCEYSSSDPEVAIVNITGDEIWVRAVGTGKAYILVSYTEGKFPFGITETDIVGVLVNQ